MGDTRDCFRLYFWPDFKANLVLDLPIVDFVRLSQLCHALRKDSECGDKEYLRMLAKERRLTSCQSFQQLALAEIGEDCLIPVRYNVGDDDDGIEILQKAGRSLMSLRGSTTCAAAFGVLDFNASRTAREELVACWRIRLRQTVAVTLGVVPVSSLGESLTRCPFGAGQPPYPKPRYGWSLCSGKAGTLAGLSSTSVLLSPSQMLCAGRRLKEGDLVEVLVKSSSYKGAPNRTCSVSWIVNGSRVANGFEDLPAAQDFAFAITLWGQRSAIEFEGGAPFGKSRCNSL